MLIASFVRNSKRRGPRIEFWFGYSYAELAFSMHPSPTTILVCDHHGQGTHNQMRPLAAVGYDVSFSSSLGDTLQQIERQAPSLLILDPLARGGTAELERLRASLPTTGVPVLLIADPDDPLPTVLAARALGNIPFDLTYRGAPMEEILLRLEQLASQASREIELDEARYAAAHDDLTGLLRASPFQKRLAEHFSACLLYTSPSPRDLSTSRMPSSA